MASRPLQVLLVEDNPGDAHLIARMITKTDADGFRVELADALATGLERLAGGGVDAVLLDLFLPDSEGIDTFLAVRIRAPQVPIVVLSGLDDQQVALRAVREGAQDYLVKRDIGGELLVRSLRYAVDRKRAEEELREREKEKIFKTIFDSSPEPVTVSSVRDGTYLEVNEKFTRFSGFDREEVLGRNPSDLGMWADATDLAALGRALAERGFVENYEVCLRTKDGTIRSTLLSAVVMEVRGQPCVLAFLRDITDRKRAEASLRELSGRLLHLQDDERRRIARELHDSTAPNLVALSMNLGAFRKPAAALGKKARQLLADSIDLAKQCSREIRTLAYLLHPPFLDELGLESALGWYVEGFAARSGIRVDLEIPPGLGRLSREIETTLFRIVQEGLTNIHRHSGSPTAKIRVTRGDSSVSLEVSDRGHGLPPEVLEEPGRLGVGMAGMRERVRQLGGDLELRSNGEGVRVRATLPLAGAGA